MRQHCTNVGHRVACDTADMTTTQGNGHLDGRVVVITGAAGGFGRLIAEMAAARGAKVVLGDIDAGAVETAAKDIGADAEGVAVDVTDLAQMQNLVARAVERFGAVDVMVNNAGVMPLAFFADHAAAYDAWVRCIDINFKGVLHGICAVHDVMLEQRRGHVVNISSIYSHAGTAGSGVYSATKSAVAVLSDSLRKESQGTIKVTVVRPTGVLGTGLAAGVVNPAAAIGIVGQNQDRYMERVMAFLSGTLEGGPTDVDSPEYWAIDPAVVAAEVVHAIDQPWGITIGDVTIRATGEDFVL
jgi:NADP-dependent 3-hydroxy acid dehydrogenase YdfG